MIIPSRSALKLWQIKLELKRGDCVQTHTGTGSLFGAEAYMGVHVLPSTSVGYMYFLVTG